MVSVCTAKGKFKVTSEQVMVGSHPPPRKSHYRETRRVCRNSWDQWSDDAVSTHGTFLSVREWSVHRPGDLKE